MHNPIETYVSYDEDGSMKLSIPTTLFGGYDRAQTCKMIEKVSDYYKQRIMKLMDDLAEQQAENDRLRARAG